MAILIDVCQDEAPKVSYFDDAGDEKYRTSYNGRENGTAKERPQNGNWTSMRLRSRSRRWSQASSTSPPGALPPQRSSRDSVPGLRVLQRLLREELGLQVGRAGPRLLRGAPVEVAVSRTRSLSQEDMRFSDVMYRYIYIYKGLR